ncbi:MAG: hypothetical protein AAGC60_25725 [Acidobacteriota bacterium]
MRRCDSLPLCLRASAVLLTLGLVLAASAVPAATTGQRLLLPYYETEMGNVFGASTLFALRNESTQSVEVTIKYYEADAPQAPQVTDPVMLGPKGVKTVNLRDVPLLEVDPDGFARGFVVFEAPTGVEIHGDYFQATPGDAFATGARLVNLDTDPCSTFSVRFLRGGAFSGGTNYVLWIDADALPLPAEAVVYSIYTEAGGAPVKLDFLDVGLATTRFSVQDLLGGVDSGLNAGVLELQLSEGLQGHLAATMSASGLYSVGLEAACRD